MLTRYYKPFIFVGLLLATANAEADQLPIFQIHSNAHLPIFYPEAVPMEQLPLPGSPAPDPPKRPWEPPPDDDPPDEPEPSPSPSPPPDPPDDEKK